MDGDGKKTGIQRREREREAIIESTSLVLSTSPFSCTLRNRAAGSAAEEEEEEENTHHISERGRCARYYRHKNVRALDYIHKTR